MLHILLTILKILGILLLVILGIVLLVILEILFVPFRYSVVGEKHKAEKGNKLYTQQDEEQQVIKVKVVASWLVHLVHFRFRLQTKEKDEISSTGSKGNSDKESKIKTDMELYLFGIPIFALKNKITANRKKSKVDTESKVQVEKQSSAETNVDAAEETVLDKTIVSETIDDVDLNVVETVLEEESNQNDDSTGLDSDINEFHAEESSFETQAEEKGNPIKNLFQTIKGIPGKIKATIENIKLTIQKVCDKIRAGSDFLKKESTKATIRLLFGKLKNIIVHILPKKIKGNLIFGFDDPALTGEVLGVASLFYPKYQKTLKLIPVFEQQILEGKLQIKGRIVIAYIVWQAIKIVLDKNARLAFKDVQKLTVELKK